MVNKYTKASTAPAPMGLPCGSCGLPGLGVRQVPLQGKPGSSVSMLICRFCHVGKPVGRIHQSA